MLLSPSKSLGPITEHFALKLLLYLQPDYFLHSKTTLIITIHISQHHTEQTQLWESELPWAFWLSLPLSLNRTEVCWKGVSEVKGTVGSDIDADTNWREFRWSLLQEKPEDLDGLFQKACCHKGGLDWRLENNYWKLGYMSTTILSFSKKSYCMKTSHGLFKSLA